MKIIDCIIFYNEINMLKYRLKTLNKVVDRFIIIEAKQTFTWKEKKQYFHINNEDFIKYKDKIDYYLIDLPKNIEDKLDNSFDRPVEYSTKKYMNLSSKIIWNREMYQRNYIHYALKKINLAHEDIILISDVDEIPDPNLLQKIKNNEYIDIIWGQGANITRNTKNVRYTPGFYKLSNSVYYYNLNTIYKNYHNVQVLINYITYEKMNKTPQQLRMSFNNGRKGTKHACDGPCYINKGGWHLSYFGNINFIINKVKNFSHQELNDTKIIDKTHILESIKNNKSFIQDVEFSFIDIIDNNYLPENYEYLQLLFKL